MTDFRARLYDRYVSAFKAASLLQGEALRSYWKWCDFRIRPLLRGLAPDARILELGCGPGYLLEYLGRIGFRNAYGVDISEEQVTLAKQRGVAASVADVFAGLDAADESLDAVLAIDLLEHFTKEEGLKLCDAIQASLQPGGRMILRTPNGSGLLSGPIIYGDMTHMAIYNESSLGQLLTVAGFERLSFHETGPVPKNFSGVVRCAAWAAARAMANVVRFAESGGMQRVWTQNIICCGYRGAAGS